MVIEISRGLFPAINTPKDVQSLLGMTSIQRLAEALAEHHRHVRTIVDLCGMTTDAMSVLKTVPQLLIGATLVTLHTPANPDTKTGVLRLDLGQIAQAISVNQALVTGSMIQ